jgi:hypothetical protein
MSLRLPLDARGYLARLWNTRVLKVAGVLVGAVAFALVPLIHTHYQPGEDPWMSILMLTVGFAFGMGIGRPWAILLPVTWIVSLGIVDPNGQFEAYLVLLIFIFVPIEMVAVASGVELRKLFHPPAFVWIPLGLLSLGIPIAGLERAEAGRGPGGANYENVTRARGPVDETAASYAGVALDDPAQRINARLGPLPAYGQAPDPLSELGAEPIFLPADSASMWTYGDVELTAKGGRVASMLVWGKGARTLRGVGVGDDLDQASEAYGSALRCTHDYSNGEYVYTPRCEMELAPRRYLYFGGDPIVVIGLSTADFRD